MSPRGVRFLRRGIVGAVLLLAVALAWSWRGGRTRPGSPSPASSPGATPSAGARTENLLFKSFKGERQSFSLAAREMVGQEEQEVSLRGVDFAFSYVSQGQPGTGTITAESCLYSPAHQRASFAGRVLMRTGDGFELRTESLIWRGDKEVARSEALVEFQRGGLSGHSKGFEYHSQEGRLSMPAEVFVSAQGAQGPPTEITATRAELAREEGTMRFLEGVQVVQGDDRLTARTFEVDFGPDQAIYRARAIEDVRAQSGSGPLPGTAAAPAGAGGPRQLACRKLDMWFAPGGLLKEVIATQDADLVLLPGAQEKEPLERRRLRSDVIHFLFDESGKLVELRTARGTAFEATPLKGKSKAAARTLTCQRLLAKVDPKSGDIQVIEFQKDLVFAQGKQKAVAQKAYYDGTNQGLYLTEQPELLDEEQGSHLKAPTIDIATGSGDLTARGGVRHVVRSKGKAKGEGSGLLGQGAPLQMSAREFSYEASSRTARYKQQALLRSGRDEVRAAEIQLQEKDGRRRLQAAGGVVALLHPSGQGRQGQAMEARAGEMTYDEAGRLVVFRADVTIKQGDIGTRSPEATITLDADGTGVETLVAGAPVEVSQASRRVTGSRATYSPGPGTLMIVGERVRLKDPEQDIVGRSLTLHLGDDRILVDGQEQVRTQTIIRGRKEPPTP